ncbi:MAG: hypothetical protein WC683_04440 [bacterium]
MSQLAFAKNCRRCGWRQGTLPISDHQLLRDAFAKRPCPEENGHQVTPLEVRQTKPPGWVCEKRESASADPAFVADATSAEQAATADKGVEREA